MLSASRDTTVRLWKRLSESPPVYDATISSHGTSFINAIAYLRPTSTFPNGLIFSGGKDTIIEARQPGRPPEDNAEALLLGHAHNVCALDVCEEGNYVVSGSWDSTGRVWGIDKWECEAMLEGHEGSVWAVLGYDKKTIITGKLQESSTHQMQSLIRRLGCADKLIRIYDVRGKLMKTIKGGLDVIRALCRLPPHHPSGADFASAGNDGIIRLWKLDGQQVGELQGHESYIYSLVSLPNGELVSAGEDRTVRIWRGAECIQTITHPAISVWGIASCTENGDIVSGASDRKVRIFTRAQERQAAPESLRAFEDAVKSSSIPQQQMSDTTNKEKLPGPDFLQRKSGTKEGQVQQIREADGSVTAHQWSQGSQSWMHIGTVVDAPGSSGRKTSYGGKEYDYVFDVDIEEGKPPLKLPYNLSQNPYEAATKFLQNNELPMTYLDQTANFITTNTQGATLGQGSQEPVGIDPWSSGAYRPGQNNSASQPSQPSSRPKVLPQTTYLSIKTANMRTILKKISELNEQIVAEGTSDISLGKDLLLILDSASKPLEQALAGGPTINSTLTDSIPIVLHMLSTWPAASRLPALDLLRLFAVATPKLAEQSKPDVISVLSAHAFDDKDRTNNIMLAVRAFGNLFETVPGRDLVDSDFDKIHHLVKEATSSPENTANRNLTIAITTLYVNYAVLFTSSDTYKSLPSSTDRAIELLDDLTTIIGTASDSEAVYRGLVAIGTLLTLDDMVQDAARDVYDLYSALKKAEGRIKEPRVKGIVAEIQGILKAGAVEK